MSGLRMYCDIRRREAGTCRTAFENRMENAMAYLRGCFGNGQEPVSLLSGLLGCYAVVMYSRPDGALYRFNDEMLSAGHDRRIEKELEAME